MTGASWHAGVTCKKCKQFIPLFPVPEQGHVTLVVPDVTFDVPCPYCGQKAVYPAAKLVTRPVGTGPHSG